MTPQRRKPWILAALWLSAASPVFGQGQVVGWGENGGGQLAPPVGSMLGFRSLAVGSSHVLAVLQDGSVSGWGGNVFGQSSPPGLAFVTSVAAGGAHSLALLSDGTIRAWGYAGDGRTTVPSNLADAIAIACGDSHNLALRSNGRIVAWGGNGQGQASAPDEVFAAIDAGYNFSIGVRGGGTVVAWGENNEGQCTAPLEPFAKVAGGFQHVVALRPNGTVRAWGRNSSQQCQVPQGLQDVVQVACASQTSLALRSDGTVVQWGFNVAAGVSLPSGLHGVRRLTSSNSSGVAFAMLADGGLRSWGTPNDQGMLAVPSKPVVDLVQVSGGAFFSVGLDSAGRVRTWGNIPNPPEDLPTTVDVSGGSYHVAALGVDGKVRCWGSDGWGQSAVPVDLPAAVDVSAGQFHTLVALASGGVVGWGLDTAGQVNPPNNVASVVQVAAGAEHSVARSSTGEVTCWGRNTSPWNNWLGQATTPADLGVAIDIAAGETQTLALLANGTVRGWGDYFLANPPQGLRDVVQVAAGYWHSLALRSDGTVACWDAGYPVPGPAPTGLAGVTAIGGGAYHALALLNSVRSGCEDALGDGSATLVVSGGSWRERQVWSWQRSGPRVPGAQSEVDLGAFGSVGSDCSAQAGTLVTRAGTSLLVPASASAAGNDFGVRVSGTARLAGRLWLLGVDGAGSTLPEDLDLPVLSAGAVEGNFDLLQTELPPPPGFFLTLVPQDVNGRTVLSLRLLPLSGGGSLAGGDSSAYRGAAVAAGTIDIDHDTFDDLALAVDLGASQPGWIQILLNDGAGNLGAQEGVLTSIPPRPTCLAVGDIDGDGNRDVAVGTASDGMVRLFRDDGSGGLELVATLGPTQGTPTSLVIMPGGGNALAGSASIAVGTTGGKLQVFSTSGALLQTVALAGVPSTAGVGQLDPIRGKGIATGGTTSNTLDGLLANPVGFVQTLLPGAGGLLEASPPMYVTAKPVSIDVADLDGDGLDDIVTANADPQVASVGGALPVLSIFRNTAGSFGGGVPCQPEGASSGLSVSLIDVDGDGDRDIVSVHRKVGTDSEAALLRVDTLGAGSPISIGQTTVLDATDPILSARGNLDGQGGEDIFLVNQPVGSSLTGSKRAEPYRSTGGSRQGDLDGDGQVGPSDIAIVLLDFGPCPGCPSDLDGSGEVDTGDIAFLLLLFD